MIKKEIIQKIMSPSLVRSLLIPFLFAITTQTHSAKLEPERLLAANPGKAVVVLYREDKLAASAIHYRPYLNDVPMAVMTRGTWSSATVPPGSYDLWLEQYAPKGQPRGVRSRAVENFEWKAGQVYYIKVDSISMPGLVSRAKGEVVDMLQASKEIKELSSAGNPLHYPVGRQER